MEKAGGGTTQHSQHKLLEQETGAGAGVGGGKTESWCVLWGWGKREREGRETDAMWEGEA